MPSARLARQLAAAAEREQRQGAEIAGERAAREDYAGTYCNPAFGSVEIDIEDQQLVCRRTPSMILDLRCEQANTFLGEYRGVAEDLREGKLEITFQADAGRITGLSEGDLVFQAVD